MQCFVYKGRDSHYIWVERENDFSPVPKEIMEKFGTPQLFKHVNVSTDAPLVAADPAEIEKDIQEKGYHIQRAGVAFTERSSKL